MKSWILSTFTVVLAIMIACAPTYSVAQMPPDADAPLWTDKPVRVDPTTQAYRRLPSEPIPKLFGLQVPANVRVTDSTRFSVTGQAYRFDRLHAVAPARVCKTGAGRRWACGGRSRMALRSLISKRFLQCAEPVIEEDETRLRDCRSGRTNVEEELVREGHAFATDSGPLATAQHDAMLAKRGVWADPECVAAASDSDTPCGVPLSGALPDGSAGQQDN